MGSFQPTTTGDGAASKRATEGTLATADYIAIALYFILVLGVGFAALFRKNRGTVSGYDG